MIPCTVYEIYYINEFRRLRIAVYPATYDGRQYHYQNHHLNPQWMNKLVKHPASRYMIRTTDPAKVERQIKKLEKRIIRAINEACDIEHHKQFSDPEKIRNYYHHLARIDQAEQHFIDYRWKDIK